MSPRIKNCLSPLVSTRKLLVLVACFAVLIAGIRTFSWYKKYSLLYIHLSKSCGRIESINKWITDHPDAESYLSYARYYGRAQAAERARLWGRRRLFYQKAAYCPWLDVPDDCRYSESWEKEWLIAHDPVDNQF